LEKQILLTVVDKLTDFVIQNDFAGYSKHDGLNSPILHLLSFNKKWLRLIFIQTIMRFPVNIRPLLFTEKSRNPKGIALFAKGFLLLYNVTNEKQYRKLAEELLGWLMENHSNKDQQFSGYCWGYNFIWQSPFFCAPKYFPNLTVSVFPGEAFLLGYQLLQQEKYLEYATGVAEYVLNDLPVLQETPTEKCLGYVSAEVSEKVININSMAAAFLSKLYAETKREKYKENAIKLVNFVVNNAIDYNRWTYTTNVDYSYVDNYHTGGVIDGILETMENLNDWRWRPTLLSAVQYYEQELFTKEGAPKNRDNREYPHDIHGAAQGIITFSKISRLEPEYLTLAEKIFDWTINNLYSGKGYFYYQKMRLYTKKFTLMRWCNAWMVYALGELLSAKAIFGQL
jgi:rhamnogalacturonyl hydrolase YesR